MEFYGIFGSTVLILFSIFLSHFIISSIFAKPKAHIKPSPPTAGGAWPFIGHLHVMGNGSRNRLPHMTLSAMADKHGPIFGIWLGSQRAVVVSSWELAKELFTKHDSAVSSRPRFPASELLGNNLAMVGFSPYGRYWYELRKLISVELLSSRRLNIQKHVVVSEIMQSIQELHKLWDDKKDESGRALANMKEWFSDLNMNVSSRMVIGKRYFGSSSDSNEARHCQKVVTDFVRLGAVYTLGDALPYLRQLDIGGYEKKMKQTSKEMNSLAARWLEEHRDEGRRQKLREGQQQDFMDVMLAVVKNANFETSEYDDDTIINSTCLNMIAGASDTITSMLVWSLSLLLNNPKVLEKAKQELDQHVGRERRVNNSDINNLIYLQAVIKESLRLYPVAPLGGIREFTQDCDVGGYHIPKGTWLFVNLWKVQRDPRIWNEAPTEFRPERFLTTSIDIMDGRSKGFEWIPFGGGRRICPGFDLALEMMPLVLANLVQAFELSTLCDEVVDMTGSIGLTNSKATPLDVLVAPRLSAALY